MNHFTMRLRVAAMSGGLGAAVGVLVFGTTTVRLLLSSSAGLLIGAAIGFFLGAQIETNRAVAQAERFLRGDVVARIMIGWSLVALGIVALVVRGCDVKIALITLGFLVVALFVTFHKRTRDGRNLEQPPR